MKLASASNVQSVFLHFNILLPYSEVSKVQTPASKQVSLLLKILLEI
jgi:hypothetical protein